jgi:hypothetical protein
MEADVNVMHLYASAANAGMFIIMRRNIDSLLECNWRFGGSFFVDIMVLLPFWWGVAN